MSDYGMKNFKKAIRDSLHHWPTILMATICSLGVAMLWGANIGALSPVIRMTLEGDSTQTWLQKSIDSDQKELERIAGEIQGNAVGAVALQKGRVDDLEKRISWNKWFLVWANAWLPKTPFETVCLIMGVLVLSTVVKHMMMLTSDLLIGRVSTEIVRNLRTRIFDQALEMDRKTYQSYGTSGILAAITHSSEALSNGLINFFGAAIREPLRIVASLAGAFIICPRLLLLSLVLAPLSILVIAWSNRKIKQVASSIMHKNTGLHDVILESLSNIFTVQAYTMEEEERARFSVAAKSMQTMGLKMVFFSGISRPFMELVGVGMIALTVCAGSYLVLNQQTHIGFIQICDEPLPIASLLLFFGFLVAASDPLRKLSGVSTAIMTGSIAADMLYGMLERPVVIKQNLAPAFVPSPHQHLTIENLSFAYDPTCPVLKSVDLQVPFGKTIVILGANGSGKSTLIQLLGRFYDPTGGRISIDGHDYLDMSIHDIRRRITLVSQTTELFNRTVMENIRYGSPNATEDEAKAAAKLAHAHNFIENALSDGYQTMVGQSGQKLSGGQRQRIALARAILRKPEILILDESTSQIDMASELQIRQTLKDLKGQFTTIIVTHREALCTLADEIYTMENGVMRNANSPSPIAA
jgi:ATP-binding cassette subfamily B protein/subfamily B ATP-binding cassette protein MsbA